MHRLSVVFTVHLKMHWVPCKDWSDCTHAQATPSLCYGHMQSWRKCCGPAHIMSDWTQCKYAFLKSNNEYTPTSIFKMRSVAINWHLVTWHFKLIASIASRRQPFVLIQTTGPIFIKYSPNVTDFQAFFVSNTPYLGSIFPFSLNFRY